MAVAELEALSGKLIDLYYEAERPSWNHDPLVIVMTIWLVNYGQKRRELGSQGKAHSLINSVEYNLGRPAVPCLG